MAVSDIEAVVEFLRKNGFSESESALMEDICEKSQLGSSDLQRFLFPMVPTLPPVKISATAARRLPLVPGGGDADDGGGHPLSSTSSDDEEFVSFASSTTELCSSDFTNPYGVHTTTRPSSQASSDGMSQFGTARDYHEFDMQNDLYWYKEKDEDYAMPPLLGISDFDADPSEDKFVMTVETGKHRENELSLNHISEGFQSESSTHYYDRQWPVNSKESGENEVIKDYYDLERNRGEEGCTGYQCSGALCACCGGAGVNHIEDPADFGTLNLKVADGNGNLYSSSREASIGCDAKCSVKNNTSYSMKSSSMNGWVGELKSTDDFQTHIIEEDYHLGEIESRNHELDGKICDPDPSADEEVGAPSDELLMYETKEDEYEVFSLRIIHRKNRVEL